MFVDIKCLDMAFFSFVLPLKGGPAPGYSESDMLRFIEKKLCSFVAAFTKCYFRIFMKMFLFKLIFPNPRYHYLLFARLRRHHTRQIIGQHNLYL